MRLSRRAVLRSFGGLTALSTLPATHVRAHADGSSDGNDTADGGTTRSDALAPRGSLAVEGATDAVVAGNTAYVAASDGFAVVDVADPANPMLLAERRGLLSDREGGPLQQVYDTGVDGDRLLVAGPAHPPDGDALMGAALYDVADPTNPTLLRFHETDYPVHNCYLQDGVAYLTGNDGSSNPLVLVDVTRDATPELARWSVVDANEAWHDVPAVLRVVHDVTVDGGVATLAYWDAGTWFLDIADPANPKPIGHTGHYEPADLTPAGNAEAFQLPGNSHYAQRRGDLLVVGREAWDIDTDDSHDGGPGGIDLYDASDLGSVTHLASIPAPPTPDHGYGGVWTTAHNFDVVGERLYTSWYRGGVTVFDVADPSNPEELGHFRDTSRFAFWTAQHADACAVATSWHGIDGNLESGVYTFPALEPTTTTTTPATSDTRVPGFGVGAALAGLGAGAAARWWRGRE